MNAKWRTVVGAIGGVMIGGLLGVFYGLYWLQANRPSMIDVTAAQSFILVWLGIGDLLGALVGVWIAVLHGP